MNRSWRKPALTFTALRQQLHTHPELGFQELRTAELAAERLNLLNLNEWGVKVHRGLSTTGVVGIIEDHHRGACERGVGLRADMDALPMTETNRFGHASQISGKMHLCGHDGHTTMLLAVAQQLAQQRNFDGAVYTIF